MTNLNDENGDVPKKSGLLEAGTVSSVMFVCALGGATLGSSFFGMNAGYIGAVIGGLIGFALNRPRSG